MGLPPKLLIQAGRFAWTSMWKLMMGQMAPSDRRGDYQRPSSQFRQVLGSDFPAAFDRYTLIVGMGCPWAHRTLIARAVKRLEAVIDVEVVQPAPEEGGWIFASDAIGFRTVREFYLSIDPKYSGRCTVPILWDRETHQIVNNESSEIIVMLNRGFSELASGSDLYPDSLRGQIDAWNEEIYTAVNNGVYQCGFAQTQAAYDQACDRLFACLDKLEATLSRQRFLCGSALTLADIRLFPTLFRFDAVYYSLFKCSRQKISDYPALSAYARDIYQHPGVMETCSLEQVRQDYFGNLFPLNPGGIIPQGLDSQDWLRPHDRAKLVAM
ncbi:MAG: glutathione S-transferase C-terminal domain-containing protein [Cyanobacteria bacterium P01_F01_bin.42]